MKWRYFHYSKISLTLSQWKLSLCMISELYIYKKKQIRISETYKPYHMDHDMVIKTTWAINLFQFLYKMNSIFDVNVKIEICENYICVCREGGQIHLLSLSHFFSTGPSKLFTPFPTAQITKNSYHNKLPTKSVF